MFSSSCARTSYVDIKASLSCIGARFELGLWTSERRATACPYSRCGFAYGLHTSSSCHQQIRNSLAKSPSVPRIQWRYIVRAKETRGRRKKAHSFCIEQESSRDTGRIAGNCQLLHGRNKDCVRREVQYARINGRTSHVAVRHSVARDERRQRAVRNGPRQ